MKPDEKWNENGAIDQVTNRQDLEGHLGTLEMERKIQKKKGTNEIAGKTASLCGVVDIRDNQTWREN